MKCCTTAIQLSLDVFLNVFSRKLVGKWTDRFNRIHLEVISTVRKAPLHHLCSTLGKRPHHHLEKRNNVLALTTACRMQYSFDCTSVWLTISCVNPHVSSFSSVKTMLWKIQAYNVHTGALYFSSLKQYRNVSVKESYIGHLMPCV